MASFFADIKQKIAVPIAIIVNSRYIKMKLLNYHLLVKKTLKFFNISYSTDIMKERWKMKDNDTAGVNKEHASEYGLRIFNERFQDLDAKDKGVYLESAYVKRFLGQLDHLSPGLGQNLHDIFLKGRVPHDWDDIRREVINLGGVVGPILIKDPGDARFMNLLYRYTFPQGPLDQFLMNCESGRAVNFRKRSVIKYTAPVIEKMIFERKDCRATILNLGSGYGHDSLEMSKKYPVIASHASFLNIDICPNAIKEGIELSRNDEYKYFPGVSFYKGNMLKTVFKNADVSWIIGVLCGFPHDSCVNHIRQTRQMMRSGGVVYGACVTDRMVDRDLFTCFILQEVLHWSLCYRRKDDVVRMFVDSGLEWREDLAFSEDETGYYVIGAGVVP